MDSLSSWSNQIDRNRPLLSVMIEKICVRMPYVGAPMRMLNEPKYEAIVNGFL